mmetsp:Transcript_139132/g.259432  ORF Transcript_139132/g.259432 Transcript_139132/m.259432 type:complete len:502 (-) Transcript_139132:86-1591(-)
MGCSSVANPRCTIWHPLPSTPSSLKHLKIMMAAPTTPRRRARVLKRVLSEDKENNPNAANCMTETSELPAKRARTAFQKASPALECPYPLVGREDECARLDAFLENSLGRGPGNGGCLYLSGGPGTGKTCSVRAAACKRQQQNPETKVLEVNCMNLSQRSVPGLLSHLLQELCVQVPRNLTTQGLTAAFVTRLAQLGDFFVIIVDEIDQIVQRRGRSSPGDSLSALFSIPQLPGTPPLALVAVANAVDLLERTALPALGLGCDSLLFEPYSAEQLRQIIKARLLAGGGKESSLKALGPAKLELTVRRVAKQCGDCRQVLSLCEEALFDVRVEREEKSGHPDSGADEDASATESRPSSGAAEAAQPVSSARPLGRSQQKDPLLAVSQLPLEQQVLLCALAGAQKEAMRISDVCSRYKDLCRVLHQPLGLTSKGQISSALSSLEQRGLLELRGGASGCARGRRLQRQGSCASASEGVAELAVAREAVRENVVAGCPFLKRCFE